MAYISREIVLSHSLLRTTYYFPSLQRFMNVRPSCITTFRIHGNGIFKKTGDVFLKKPHYRLSTEESVGEKPLSHL